MLALGAVGRHKEVQEVLQALMLGDHCNEHTYAACISALDQAGRFDIAIQRFEELCRRGVDVGPVCASVLIKMCAQRRDLALALNIFHM